MHRKHFYLFVVALVGLIGSLTLFLLMRGREVWITAEVVPVEEVAAEQTDTTPVYVSPFKNLPDFPVRAIYSTFYTASTKRFIGLMDLVQKTSLNAIVVDVKDSSGTVGFNSENELAKESGAITPYITDLHELVQRMHERRIYAIARLVVFQDPFIAKLNPDWAVQAKSGGVWRDRKGIAWLNPVRREVWEYTVAIAREAAAAGFDEINFDYVRFPSDGDIENATFPGLDEGTEKYEVMREFFEFLYTELNGEVKLSADVFGQTFYDYDDLGIGQLMEVAAPYFDYLAPMVYPSHYIKGFLGFPQPALRPYEVVKTTLEVGQQRQALLRTALADTAATNAPAFVRQIRDSEHIPSLAKVRPWLQDFNLLGITYGKQEVEAQIRAAEETGSFGWMLWSPDNIYTESALGAAD